MIDHAAAHIGLVEKSAYLLVKAADADKCVAPERAIGAQKMRVLGGQRKIQFRHSALPVVGQPEAIKRHITCLITGAALIVDKSSGPADNGRIIGGSKVGQPFRFRDGIIIQESQDMPGCQREADIARHREIAERASRDFDLSLPRLQ